MKEKVLLVGLGQIGMGYDLNHPETHIFTHARAFSLHPDFELIGAIDPDSQKIESFQKNYSIPAFSSFKEALTLTPNVVVIGTPTSSHLADVEEILGSFNPKIVLCEKPLANDPDEAIRLVELCEKSATNLYVNYMRRSSPGSLRVLKMIKEGDIQGPFKANVWYSKGLYNSGSHFIDLMRLWMGEMKDFKILNQGRKWNKIDPEPDFVAYFEQGQVQFTALKEENFFHNSFELYGTNGRLRYEQGGALITWEKVSSNPLFTGYKTLEKNEVRLETEFNTLQWHVAEELSKSLKGQLANLCNGREALLTLQACIKIGRST
jgi:predicted dehydrogenase